MNGENEVIWFLYLYMTAGDVAFEPQYNVPVVQTFLFRKEELMKGLPVVHTCHFTRDLGHCLTVHGEVVIDEWSVIWLPDGLYRLEVF